ncbi:MAG: glycosyltransferase [Solirubrobacterales bacterium]|nr:glycosyltransferase [Solirubrobacterales bacterium]
MPGTWVVIPTYNEAEVVEDLVRAVHRELTADAGEFHILVVDDGSPDGTGAIVDRLATELPEVEVLHRNEKDGLGRAYIAGFGRALEAGADVVAQMDADFSHAPADVPRLLAAVREGADMALGSRYVRGGGVEDWGPVRRAISRGGCAYARAVLGVRIRDLTGGFKALRADTLRAIDLPAVRSEGYAFQIEVTYRALLRGLRVVELPIVFRDRRLGHSKMSARIALEAIVLVPRLRRLRGR